MGRIEKLLNKLYRKPVPNDMRIDEIIRIVTSYGCITDSGGKHQLKIIHRPTGTVIPIPKHGDTVAEAYIKEIKALLDEITSEEETE